MSFSSRRERVIGVQVVEPTLAQTCCLSEYFNEVMVSGARGSYCVHAQLRVCSPQGQHNPQVTLSEVTELAVFRESIHVDESPVCGQPEGFHVLLVGHLVATHLPHSSASSPVISVRLMRSNSRLVNGSVLFPSCLMLCQGTSEKSQQYLK